MKDAFPEIVHTTRFSNSHVIVGREDKLFQERIALIDPPYLQMFTFPLLAGDANTALDDLHSVVISERVAKKYFGETENYAHVIGQSLRIKGSRNPQDFVVTGIMKALPLTSSMRGKDILIPFENAYRDDTWYFRMAQSRNGNVVSTYVQIQDASQATALNEKLASFTSELLDKQRSRWIKSGRIQDRADAFQLHLQALIDIHFQNEVRGGYAQKISPMFAYVLSAIGMAVLLIACINFTTLSLGQSAQRSLEVGIRKVLGAHRGNLMRQFWGETLLMSLLALLLGLALVELFLSVFNNTIGGAVAIVPSWELIVALMGILVFVGLVAGSYPALILSKFQPILVFKGNARIGRRKPFTRALVIVQYALSIVLMICTGIMAQQLDYLQSKSLGYTSEQVVVLDKATRETPQRLRDALRGHDRIVNIAGGGYSFVNSQEQRGHRLPNGKLITIWTMWIDEAYLKTLGIDLKTGRNFSTDFPSDPQRSVIVNETLVDIFGWDDPIGQPVPVLNKKEPHQVIGVVKNFHFQSLHNEIKPIVFYNSIGDSPGDRGPSVILVRIRPEDLNGSIELLRETWKKIEPARPFSFVFLDQQVNEQYHAEQRWVQIVWYASGFGILIACLGLFGLASLSVSQRTKEIGIRKVLGASAGEITALISREFVLLLTIANIIAWPVTYWTMGQWLNGFAYRIAPGVKIYLLCSLLAIVIALCTISLQAIRAARSNPVDTLRYE
ncbi:MAG: ABC transporter permease [Candidatus Latescibacteria bacterium]|nr:ABC transporter permease [Candidatus Latescibacterota bacterium]